MNERLVFSDICEGQIFRVIVNDSSVEFQTVSSTGELTRMIVSSSVMHSAANAILELSEKKVKNSYATAVYGSVANLATELYEVYEIVYNREYNLTGSIDLAKNKAARVCSQKFGVSRTRVCQLVKFMNSPQFIKDCVDHKIFALDTVSILTAKANIFKLDPEEFFEKLQNSLPKASKKIEMNGKKYARISQQMIKNYTDKVIFND